MSQVKLQVRLADQARYPHVLWPLRWTIAHSAWMGLKQNTRQFKRIPVTTRGTHTHTRLPEERRKAKVRANVHLRAHNRQKNEDMTGGRDGTKVRVVEPSAQGHPMKPTSL